MTCGAKYDLYVGQTGPFPVDVPKLTGDTWDPTAIVSALIHVEKPDGSAPITWTGSISNVSSSGLRVTYSLGPSSIDVDATWSFYVSLSDGVNTFRTETFAKIVGKAFAR